MMYKKPFKLISVMLLLLAMISCFSSFTKSDNSNLLIGKWEGKWDDISVLLEFEVANKGSISYSNPLKKIAFVYKIQKDSVFLKYPKSIKGYKFSVKDDELFLNSKESDQESAEIIELITYVKKK